MYPKYKKNLPLFKIIEISHGKKSVSGCMVWKKPEFLGSKIVIPG